MACHPSGTTVNIVGISALSNDRSCKKHETCGCLLAPDVVVRFRTVQVGKKCMDPKALPKETAIAVYHVTGGVDACRVGFLCCHLVKYEEEYDGRLAQVIEVFNEESESPSDRAKHHRNFGCCRAALIEQEYSGTSYTNKSAPNKKRKIDDPQQEKEMNENETNETNETKDTNETNETNETNDTT